MSQEFKDFLNGQKERNPKPFTYEQLQHLHHYEIITSTST